MQLEIIKNYTQKKKFHKFFCKRDPHDPDPDTTFTEMLVDPVPYMYNGLESATPILKAF